MSTVIKKINKKSSFTAFFFVLFFLANGIETEQADSLLNRTIYYWEISQKDSAGLCAKELIDLSPHDTNNRYYALANFYLGRYYQNKGMIDTSSYHLKESLKFLIQNDTLKAGIALFIVGVNYSYMNDIESSLIYYHKSNSFLQNTNDSAWNSVLNNYLSITYFEIGDYPSALRYSFISLDFLETSSDSLSIGNIYNTIGNIYRKMGNSKKEKQAYDTAINILTKIPINLALAMAYTNISELYLNSGSTELGFNFLEKAKETYIDIAYPLGICSYYSVKSNYYFYLQPPLYDSVIRFSEKSIKIALDHKDYRQYADASNYLGKAYLKTNQFSKAERVLINAYQKANQYHLLNEELNLAESLSILYQKKNEFKKAYKYSQVYNQLKDSLYNADRIKEFTSLNLQYQFQQEQIQDSLANQLEKAKILLRYESEIETHNLQMLFLLSFTVLLIGFVLFVLFISLKRKKTNHILKKKNETISQQSDEIKANSIKIQNALKELKELDQYKQSFINMLVHDLKNPLNALVNIETFETEKQRVEITKYNSEQMLRLVLNMLDISKAESHRLELQLSEFSILSLLNQVVKGVDYFRLQKAIEIDILCNSDYQIEADKDLLSRLLTNLLVNALKYSPRNESISIKVKVFNQNLKISIKDNGPGIPIEGQKQIFDLYQQYQPKNSGFSHSSGIGLAFCKITAEAHKWQIGVHSSKGLGAEFWLIIPDFKINNFKTSTNIKTHSIKTELIDLNNKEINILLPYLIQLQKLNIYEISDIKLVLDHIKQLNIQQLDNWIEDVSNSVSSYDEGKYTYLINSLLNS